jgi:hypothetical protein
MSVLEDRMWIMLYLSNQEAEGTEMEVVVRYTVDGGFELVGHCIRISVIETHK